MKKLFSSSLLIIILAFTACQKTNTQQIKSINSNFNSNLECTNLNFDSLNIGQKHNEVVLELLEDVNVDDTSTIQSIIKNNFFNQNFDASLFSLSKAEYSDLIFNLTNNIKNAGWDLRNMDDSDIKLSPSYSYIAQILSSVDSIKFNDSNSYNDFCYNLDIIKTEVEQNLSCIDKDIVLATISCARGSAKLWLPEEYGGNGELGNIHPQYKQVSENVKRIIRNVILADLSALSGDFIKMGTMIAAGMEVPGANVIILTSLAMDAAFASAISSMFP